MTLVSSIPMSHPQKAVIEDAIRTTLESLPGRWVVSIRLSGADLFGAIARDEELGWSVDVNRTGRFWGLRIPPDQQNPEGVASLLRQTVSRSAGEGSGRPRRR